MARSAGFRFPVGLARRSRRVLAAALVALLALAVPVTISLAKGDGGHGGPPPHVVVVHSPQELQKKQAEFDRQVQNVQDEAAKKQAEIDKQAQKLADETARKQAKIDEHAQHLADDAARKQGELDTKAQSLPAVTSIGSAPTTVTSAQAAPAQPTPSVPAATAPRGPKHASHPPEPSKQVRHIVHEQAEVEHRRAELSDHFTKETSKLQDQRDRLSGEISRKQAELARRRAEVDAWLAKHLAALLRRSLSLVVNVKPPPTKIPPAVFEPAPPAPPIKVIDNGTETTVIAPGVPATPTPPVTTQTPSKSAPTPPVPGKVSTPAPAAAAPAPATAPAAATPVTGLVSPVAAAPGAKKRAHGGRHGSTRQTTPLAPKRRAPVAVVLHPLARAVAEIPRTVWVGMGGLGALALALALVSVLQSRRTLKLVAAQRSLRADVASLSSAVAPAVPAAIGGLAISVATRAPKAAARRQREKERELVPS
jgi:Skp family chaperone for outer membrane proteins